MSNINVDDIKYRLTPTLIEKDSTKFSRTLDHKNYNTLEWNENSKNNYAFKCHYGQRKLLFSEIELFNKVQIKSGVNLTVNYKDPPFYVVYAGSAAGHHIVYLLEMFPALRFILYDPAQFDKSVFNNPKIYVKTGTPDGYFTDNSASQEIYTIIQTYFLDVRSQQRKTEKGYELIFISDIRKSPNERGIFEDMMFQQKWGILMNAYVMLLKFRLPYTTKSNTSHILPPELDVNVNSIRPQKDINKQYKHYELDSLGNVKSEKEILGIIGDYPNGIIKYYCNHVFSDPTISPKAIFPIGIKSEEEIVKKDTTEILYLDGDIYWQITAPYHSTETRLIVFRNNEFKYNFKYYNSHIYESECFYFNNVDNVSVTFKYKDNQLMKLHLAGADDGYGCTSEYAIIEEYITTNYKSTVSPSSHRIIALLYDINKFLYMSTYKKSLILCNTETFLKYIGLLQPLNDEEYALYSKRIDKMSDEEKKLGFKQLLQSIELNTISCNIQKRLFKKLITEDNGILTKENYKDQVSGIDHSINIQLNYIKHIEKYKTFRDIIKSIIDIRQHLNETIKLPLFDETITGEPSQGKIVLKQERAFHNLKDNNKSWDVDKERFNWKILKKPEHSSTYVDVSRYNKKNFFGGDVRGDVRSDAEIHDTTTRRKRRNM
jgi:hypothetical protein